MPRSEKRQLGDVVNGRFLVQRELGSGAMGEVFLAHDGILDRDVAMKYLKWLPDRPSLIEHFKSEFATLTHLSHPHITKVFDFAQDDCTRQYFFTSEFIGGRDFFAFSATLAPKQIEGLFVQALRALEYLHGNNIFHFDIKPQNVLITGELNDDGTASSARVQVIDFGMAAVGFQNKLVGTPSYMAPEIILKNTPTGQADLYSLGVLIYYALTRWNPFRGQAREETFSRHCTFLAPAPSSRNPKIPTYLDDIILRLLAKRPEDRYASASQVIQDINLRCGNTYPVETPETLLAYIPWEGPFIGRTKILKETEKILEACFQGRQERPPVLWIRGQRGAGKSRLLREIKFSAQLAGHTTHIFDRADITSRMAWLAAIDSGLEDPRQPTVFFMDDVHTLIAERLATEIVDGLRSLIAQIRSHVQLSTAQPSHALVVISSPSDSTLCKAVEDALRLPPKSAHVINLAPFTTEELHTYLATLTGLSEPPSALVEKLYAHTEGNPLFLTEVIKQLIIHRIIIDEHGRWKATTFEDLGLDFQRLQVPPTVEAIVAQEYARLSQPQQEIAAALAVWGKPITVDTLARLLTAPVAKEHLAGLIQRGLVSYDPLHREYAFRNMTKQRGVYHQLGTEQRRTLHARSAEILRDDPETSLEEIYAHQGQCGEGQTTEHALWELARHQLEVHRPHDAIPTLQQLLQVSQYASTSPGGIDARLLLARAYREIRDFAAARTVYEEILGCLVPDPDQHVRLAQVQEELGIVALKAADYAAAEQHFMQALAITLHETDDRARRLRLENYIGQTQLYRGAIAQAVTTFTRTWEATHALSFEERRQVTNNDLGYAYYEQGAHQKAIAQLETDAVFYGEVDDTPRAMRARYFLASAHLALRQYHRAAGEYRQVLELAKKCNDIEYLTNAYTGLGNAARAQQHGAEVIAFYERALDLSGRLGNDERTAGIAINLGTTCRAQGMATRAEGYLLSALGFLENTARPGELHERYHCEAHLELGEFYRLQRNFPRAGHHLDEAWTLACRHANCAPFRFWIALTRAELLRDEGERAKAREALKAVRALAADDLMRQQLEETEKSVAG